MMANMRAKGNRLENQGRKVVDAILEERGFKCYSIASRNSRGVADVVHIASLQGKYFPFGVQYKVGYVSPNYIERSIEYAFKEYNLVLFYGVKRRGKEGIVFTPDIERYIDDISSRIREVS